MSNDTPSLKSALHSAEKEHWQAASAEELESLEAAGTWVLTERPPRVRVFPSRIILKVKRGSDGSIDRHKARLVLLGHLKRPEIDYNEKYAQVADFTVIRALLAKTAAAEWLVHQKDVKCAFLNGNMDEDIYLSLPEEYAHPQGLVCKFQKSIYGLKQAPRAWNKKFTSDLRKSGFIPLVNAESAFTGVFMAATVFLICYVDDIVILTKSKRALKAVKSILVGLYQVKDMGERDYLLGVKIERELGRVMLSQNAYLGNVLTRFGMTECKSEPNPMAQPAELMAKRAPSEAERSEMRSTPFRAASGSLLYLSTRTSPDITVSVSILAKHSQDPSPIHWQGVKRAMRYLKGTMN
jgi:hypothetical protein